jgi:hypothetical protein
MNTNTENIQILCHRNEEKESRIIELEERLQHVKIDERSLQSFKISVENARNELEGAIIDMYTHFHLFQNEATISIE